jgi:formyl-CoA transferase
MPGALDGVKIIDLTAVLLGPFATQHMADMGADVIKIEPPEGDLLRVSGRGPSAKMGPIYMAAGRNKRSVCLDLKKPAAVAVVKRLVKDADIFIHNSRPQAIERLGLGYDDLTTVKPDLIYAYSLGYKRSGPYGHKPAFDDLVQGASGAASLQSRVDGGPPRFLPSLIADKTTGLHLAIAVLGALVHRQRTGQGQAIEVPMFETLVSFWMTEHLFGEMFHPPTGTMGYDRIINKFRKPFKTADGYICALPYTDKHWERFFEIANRPDLARDPRFKDGQTRAQHYSDLYQVLDSLLLARPTGAWLALFDEADIPAMPVNSLEQLRHDPHLAATGFFTEREHPTEGRITTMASPLDFSATPTSFRRHAPRTGVDGPDVLRQHGYSAAEIEALMADKALLIPTFEAPAPAQATAAS